MRGSEWFAVRPHGGTPIGRGLDLHRAEKLAKLESRRRGGVFFVQSEQSGIDVHRFNNGERQY
jgi:hypothetical protein